MLGRQGTFRKSFFAVDPINQSVLEALGGEKPLLHFFKYSERDKRIDFLAALQLTGHNPPLASLDLGRIRKGIFGPQAVVTALQPFWLVSSNQDCTIGLLISSIHGIHIWLPLTNELIRIGQPVESSIIGLRLCSILYKGGGGKQPDLSHYLICITAAGDIVYRPVSNFKHNSAKSEDWKITSGPSLVKVHFRVAFYRESGHELSISFATSKTIVCYGFNDGSCQWWKNVNLTRPYNSIIDISAIPLCEDSFGLALLLQTSRTHHIKIHLVRIPLKNLTEPLQNDYEISVRDSYGCYVLGPDCFLIMAHAETTLYRLENGQMVKEQRPCSFAIDDVFWDKSRSLFLLHDSKMLLVPTTLEPYLCMGKRDFRMEDINFVDLFDICQEYPGSEVGFRQKFALARREFGSLLIERFLERLGIPNQSPFPPESWTGMRSVFHQVLQYSPPDESIQSFILVYLILTGSSSRKLRIPRKLGIPGRMVLEATMAYLLDTSDTSRILEIMPLYIGTVIGEVSERLKLYCQKHMRQPLAAVPCDFGAFNATESMRTCRGVDRPVAAPLVLTQPIKLYTREEVSRSLDFNDRRSLRMVHELKTSSDPDHAILVENSVEGISPSCSDADKPRNTSSLDNLEPHTAAIPTRTSPKRRPQKSSAAKGKDSELKQLSGSSKAGSKKQRASDIPSIRTSPRKSGPERASDTPAIRTSPRKRGSERATVGDVAPTTKPLKKSKADAELTIPKNSRKSSPMKPTLRGTEGVNSKNSRLSSPRERPAELSGSQSIGAPRMDGDDVRQSPRIARKSHGTLGTR